LPPAYDQPSSSLYSRDLPNRSKVLSFSELIQVASLAELEGALPEARASVALQ
jgi:hypothetical protein